MIKTKRKETVRKIKDHFPLIEYMESIGFDLKKSGENKYQAVCILHNDKNPSVSVYFEDEWKWKCWGCGHSVGGDVINLYSKYHNLSNDDSIQAMKLEIENGRRRIPPAEKGTGFNSIGKNIASKEKRLPSLKALPPHNIFKALMEFCGGLSDEHRAYLNENRKLSNKTLEQFKLFSIKDHRAAKDFLISQYDVSRLVQHGLLDKAGEGYVLHFHMHPIIIPIYENGEIACLRGRFFYNGLDRAPDSWSRNTEPYTGTKDIWHKLFNGDSLKTLPPGADVMLCEGEIDTMTAIQGWGKNAVGLCGVQNYGKETIERLKQFNLAVVFDNDDAGRRENVNVCHMYWELAGKEAIKNKWTKEGEDLNELYIRSLTGC